MKKLKPIFLAVMCMINGFPMLAQLSGGGEANPDLPTHKESIEKFKDMRLGMFIHWGPVTLRGEEIGWSRGVQIPKEEYDNLYREFNPVLFNASDWVRTAKNAGMKYMIITSRHHDGFSLWDSEYTSYDMASTPYGKGVLKCLADECREQGIEFGTYYSICDWSHPDYPVEYPDSAYNFREERALSPEEKILMDRYVEYMKNQLRELIEHYSTFVMWFDGEWEWAWTHEMGMDMYAYVRGLKNDILVNNRVDKGREGMAGTTRSNIYAGDFATPEQTIGAFDHENTWETCMTIGEQWAWKPNDQLKSKKECLHTLARTIGGDGNLLFNVGPMPDGRIEQRQMDRLKDMGEWIAVNQEAVYGTRGGPYLPSDIMVSTHKDHKIYLHLLKNPGRKLKLSLDREIKIIQAYFLCNKKSLPVSRDKESFILTLPELLPDDINTVIVLELNSPASEIQPIIYER